MSIPKGCYVYAIHVDGVLRYIGKGTGDRMFAHMKEGRLRQTRQFWVKNISPPFQQKLTEAVVKGAVVEEIVLADDLTSKQDGTKEILGIWIEQTEGAKFWLRVMNERSLLYHAEIEHRTARDSTIGGEKPFGARGAVMDRRSEAN